MRHGWKKDHLPALQIVSNIQPKAITSRAVAYIEAYFHGIVNTPYYMVATFNSNSALRRRDPATNTTIYLTDKPKLQMVDEIHSIAGSAKPHFDPSLKKTIT